MAVDDLEAAEVLARIGNCRPVCSSSGLPDMRVLHARWHARRNRHWGDERRPAIRRR